MNAGTSALYRNLFQLLCGPGHQALLPLPYYGLYKVCALLAGADIAHYDIDLASGSIDIPSFRAAYDPDRTALVVLNSPGNPLGNIISTKDVLTIDEVVRDRSFVLHDEMYGNVSFYEQHQCALAYLQDDASNHIVTNGFSKGFRMYTKRIGYAIVPDQLVTPMRILQQHTLLTCSGESVRSHSGPG